jgi:hypothetical protein
MTNAVLRIKLLSTIQGPSEFMKKLTPHDAAFQRHIKGVNQLITLVLSEKRTKIKLD